MDLELLRVGRSNMDALEPSGLREVLYELGPASALWETERGLDRWLESGREDVWYCHSGPSIGVA